MPDNENESTQDQGQPRGRRGQDPTDTPPTESRGGPPKVGYAPTGASEGVKPTRAVSVEEVQAQVKALEEKLAALQVPGVSGAPQAMVSNEFVPMQSHTQEPPALREDLVLPPPPSMVGNAGGLVPPSGVPPPKAFFSGSSSYLIMPRDFMASTIGMRVTSYMLDSSAITADSNGDKIVREGTVLAISTGTLLKPREDAETAVGIQREMVNARDSNKEIGLVIAGAVNINKLWDDGNFGVVASSVITDLPFIQFRNEDV